MEPQMDDRCKLVVVYYIFVSPVGPNQLKTSRTFGISQYMICSLGPANFNLKCSLLQLRRLFICKFMDVYGMIAELYELHTACFGHMFSLVRIAICVALNPECQKM